MSTRGLLCTRPPGWAGRTWWRCCSVPELTRTLAAGTGSRPWHWLRRSDTRKLWSSYCKEVRLYHVGCYRKRRLGWGGSVLPVLQVSDWWCEEGTDILLSGAQEQDNGHQLKPSKFCFTGWLFSKQFGPSCSQDQGSNMKVYTHSGFVWWRIVSTVQCRWRAGDTNHRWVFTVTPVEILDAFFQVRMFLTRQGIALLCCLKQQEGETQIPWVSC